MYRRAQKGLGRYRFRSEEEELKAARVSIRRWWWEFLRLSKDYWLVSQTGGRTLDERLQHVWRKFGDVHSVTFDEWWLRRGADIFHEQTEAPKVQLLLPEELGDLEVRPGYALIEVPIILRKETALRQIRKRLDEVDFERPRNILATSQSAFPINPVPFRITALSKTHEVWVEHRECILKPKYKSGDQPLTADQRVDLFKLGKRLRLSYANTLPSDNHDEWLRRQNRMRATVGRYLTKANALIGHVEHGAFPCFGKIQPQAKRFSAKQLERHKELEAQWWELDLSPSLDAYK